MKSQTSLPSWRLYLEEERKTQIKVGIIYSMLDRSFNKKNKAGKRVWCGGNSYHFRETKEDVTEEVLSEELKPQTEPGYTEGCLSK